MVQATRKFAFLLLESPSVVWHPIHHFDILMLTVIYITPKPPLLWDRHGYFKVKYSNTILLWVKICTSELILIYRLFESSAGRLRHSTEVKMLVSLDFGDFRRQLTKILCWHPKRIDFFLFEVWVLQRDLKSCFFSIWPLHTSWCYVFGTHIKCTLLLRSCVEFYKCIVIDAQYKKVLAELKELFVSIF